MRVSSPIFIALIALARVHAGELSGAPELFTAKEVLTLSESDAWKQIPVQVSGVVTAANPTWDGKFFVQDQSGGVFVGDGSGPTVHPGDRVEVTGVTHPGAFAPFISIPTWRVLGSEALPIPTELVADELFTGAHDGQRVQMEGWIHSFGPDGLVVRSGGTRFNALLSDVTGIEASRVTGAKVRLTGVPAAGWLPGAPRQLRNLRLYLNSASDVVVLEAPPPAPLEPLPFNRVGEYRNGETPGNRTRADGVVSYLGEDAIYLTDGFFGLMVQHPRDLANVAVGDSVSAVGFPVAGQSKPFLEDADVHRNGERRPPAARMVTGRDLLKAENQYAFVAVKGRLIDRLQRPLRESLAGRVRLQGLTLVVDCGGRVISAILQSNAERSEFPELARGAQVRLEGICLQAADAAGRPVLAQIIVPSAGNVQILEKASRWTPEMLLKTLSGVLAVLLLVSGWALALVRRNSRLGAEVRESEVIMAERARFAHDLHDSMQQSLLGVKLHLEAATRDLTHSPEKAAEHIESARGSVLEANSEIKRSIWNLRPASLDNIDLARAITRTAKWLSEGTGIQIATRLEGEWPHLNQGVEENLFRIWQEAFTNVFKHSGATHAEIVLRCSGETLEMLISDGGRGFDVEDGGVGTGFGIRGMRERAERIGAVLEIESAPERGSVVRLQMKLTPAHHSESAPSIHDLPRTHSTAHC